MILLTVIYRSKFSRIDSYLTYPEQMGVNGFDNRGQCPTAVVVVVVMGWRAVFLAMLNERLIQVTLISDI